MNSSDHMSSLLRKAVDCHPLRPEEFPSDLSESMFFRHTRCFQEGIDLTLHGLRPALQPERRDIEIFVVPNASGVVNAFALPNSRPAIISVTAGLLIRLRQMFAFVTYNCELYPQLPGEVLFGNPDDLLGGLTTAVLLEPADLRPRATAHGPDGDFLHLFAPIAPSAPRLDLANRMTSYALGFVVWHEFAHIIRGHASAIGLTDEVATFCETSRDGVSVENEIARQMVELDADITAAGLTSIAVENDPEETWGAWATTRRESLEQTVMTLALTWMLVGKWDQRPDDQRGQHPHPFVRTLVSLAHMMGFAEDRQEGLKSDELKSAASAGLQRAMTAWKRMQLPATVTDQSAVAALAMSSVLMREYAADWAPRFGASRLAH